MPTHVFLEVGDYAYVILDKNVALKIACIHDSFLASYDLEMSHRGIVLIFVASSQNLAEGVVTVGSRVLNPVYIATSQNKERLQKNVRWPLIMICTIS
jgi:hypothetical protein